MLKIDGIRIDYANGSIVDNTKPAFTWMLSSFGPRQSSQKAYELTISVKNDDGTNTIIWSSGIVETKEQECRLADLCDIDLPRFYEKNGEKLCVMLYVIDDSGVKSKPVEKRFVIGNYDSWPAKWIKDTCEPCGKAMYFTKELFINKEDVYYAAICACGIGYHKVYVNGHAIDDAVMQPLHTDYSARCTYVLSEDIQKYYVNGKNIITIVVGDGWRRINSDFVRLATGHRKIALDGDPAMSAVITNKTQNGVETIISDDTWQVSYGPIIFNNLFDGESYDANVDMDTLVRPVQVTESPCPIMDVQTIAPIREQEIYKPVAVFKKLIDGKMVYICDFGQNMAGLGRLTLPAGMTKGQTITVKYAELIKEDGTLFMEPLRDAKCTDHYTASADERDLAVWQPLFTYHGFRYAQIENYDTDEEGFDKDKMIAVSMYTDILSQSSFVCGNPTINQIHKNSVQTEKSNIHGILTDCPQRNERMGWMNDATVRYDATPYNFDVGHIFPKIVRDIKDTQTENGITCTAPHIYGQRPTDPVCSSYLIAGLNAYLHTGNIDIIKYGYEGFKLWEKTLLDRSDDYIVNYSYYGDWASPSFVCRSEEDAYSSITPGRLMSTGYSYFNCTLLVKMAEILGRSEDVAYYTELGEKIRNAYIREFYDKETHKFATGSQACQIFSLFTGIAPEEDRAEIINVVHDELVENGYCITTGNLCTRYIMEMLCEYGYVDDAYAILTKMDYPSFGLMINNEATTIWERFELKKDPSMNSHNHPMYGAVDYWCFAYLCGIKVMDKAASYVEIKPYVPSQMNFANATYASVKGDIEVKWVRRYGNLSLYVTLPVGVQAKVEWGGKVHNVEAGSHVFVVEDC